MLKHPSISRYTLILLKGHIACKTSFPMLDKLTVFLQLRVLVFKTVGYLEILLTSPALQHGLSPHLLPLWSCQNGSDPLSSYAEEPQAK